jgi:hypothetical protein
MTPPGWKCNKRVGFLFPHPCERQTPVGCPDCRNGQVDDPYRFRDRYGYSDDFDVYEGGEAAMPFAFGGGDSGGGGASDDFTEADGESLLKPDDGFEDDLSAS